MLEHTALTELRCGIRKRIEEDSRVLHELRSDVRPLAQQQHRIRPRSATAVSLVATDGGNNQVRFDPFLIQLVRVVDSNRNELRREVISPTIPIDDLDRRHLSAGIATQFRDLSTRP